MSNSQSNGSGGTNLSSGGATDNNSAADTTSTESKSDSVKYETYTKVLSEKKKRDEEVSELKKQLESFQSKDKEREETNLKAKEDYKKLLEIRDKELKESRDKHAGLLGTLEQVAKRGAFLDAVSGTIDEQYYSLIDMKNIVIDPSTGIVDEASVLKAAKDFEAKYPLVIKRSSGNGLPNDAAKGGSTKLTYEEWKSLPLKEQKSRLKEVL